MRWRSGKNTRDERGASAVEFALVVVPPLMVIAGITNFGLVFAQQLSLDNAVRAGARAGVVDRGAAATSPTAIVQNQYNSTAIARSLTSAVTVTNPGGVGTTCKNSAFGASFVVRGTVRANFLIPWPLPGVSQSVNLASQAEFQCEYK